MRLPSSSLLAGTLLAALPLASAWLPHERNLFDTTAPTDAQPVGGRHVKRTLPSTGKIRGVNLGSLFIVEPWMASSAWSSMGCGDAPSEFDCIMALGQEAGNAAFRSHWANWVNETDFDEMVSYGLNTVRIPVGYWIFEAIVYEDSEYFPQGGLYYLDLVVGWAAARGMYVILDLHGAPGAQVAEQPFTGQYAPTAGFYVDYQYARAYSFLTILTKRIHSHYAYRTVGMVEVVNEPIAGQASLLTTYYPTAYATVRQAEADMGIADNTTAQLHVQFMSASWGAGDPQQSLPDSAFNLAFDNHRYLKYDTAVTVSQAGYLDASCADAVVADGEPADATLVGEWSLSVASDVENSDAAFIISDGGNKAFYQRWWAAQVQAYERAAGWVFWSWKAELGDYRWSYRDAVAAGVIPADVDEAYTIAPCS